MPASRERQREGREPLKSQPEPAGEPAEDRQEGGRQLNQQAASEPAGRQPRDTSEGQQRPAWLAEAGRERGKEAKRAERVRRRPIEIQKRDPAAIQQQSRLGPA